jgi:hypothetical protein
MTAPSKTEIRTRIIADSRSAGPSFEQPTTCLPRSKHAGFRHNIRSSWLILHRLAPPLTDREFDVAFREGSTDEDIEAVLRHLVFWSYIMRDPFGKVCAVGRGTRAECIKKRSTSPTGTQSKTSRLSRTHRKKPKLSTAHGDSCFGLPS